MSLLNGSFPAFDFDPGGVYVALVRGLFVVSLFSAYGTILFRVRLAGVALKPMPDKSGAALSRLYDRLSIASLSAALMAAILWLGIQAWVLFASHGAGQLLHAISDTLVSTSFGHLVLIQGVFILASLGCVLASARNSTFRDFSLGAAGIAILLQVGHGHAVSMYDGFSFLLVSEIAHLFAGAAWLGSLLPLLVTIRQASPSIAHAIAGRFSAFGSVCVRVLALTAAFQGWQLVGSVPGLLGTAYGWVSIVKIVLFATLLFFAASNRYILTPRLGRNGTHVAKTDLVRSIAVETVAGFAILMAASTLVTLPPSIHEQPVWPFTSKFSLVTVIEAPEFFGQVVLALFALTMALAITGAGIYFKRVRWPAVAVAAVIAWFAIPHLGLLFVEAYPTSFYHSTTGFAATSIARGQELFPDNCASCHGSEGRGDGPLAAGLPEPPADLTADHLWAHADGELFWWLTDGIKSPEGQQAMPGFGSTLSEEERWNLIDYIRANNAGQHYAATGSWSPNIQAPKFQADCKSGTVNSDDLKGRVIRLVFGNAMPDNKLPDDVAGRLVTVLATPAGMPVGDAQCLAHDPSLAIAYATAAGVTPAALPGMEFLIDTNGWLRAVQKPGETINWNDPGKLEEQVLRICNHPLASAADHSHHH